MKRPVSPALWLAPAAALVLPPLLLIPLIYRLPHRQLFKDFYEACLWLSPAVGMVVLAVIFRRKRGEPDLLRRGVIVAGIIFACVDLVSPLFFYILLAVLAGR